MDEFDRTPMRKTGDTDRKVLEALDTHAAVSLGAPRAQVALAWVLQKTLSKRTDRPAIVRLQPHC